MMVSQIADIDNIIRQRNGDFKLTFSKNAPTGGRERTTILFNGDRIQALVLNLLTQMYPFEIKDMLKTANNPQDVLYIEGFSSTSQ